MINIIITEFVLSKPYKETSHTTVTLNSPFNVGSTILFIYYILNSPTIYMQSLIESSSYFSYCETMNKSKSQVLSFHTTQS